MRKTTKKILVLCMAVIMTMGMAGTAFASGGATVNLKSNEGYLDNVISLSNVIGTENMEYIEGKDLPTYLCNSPAEVTALGGVTVLMVQKVTDENLEKVKKGEEFWMNEVPLNGQATIWDAETGEELIIDYKDMNNYEVDGPPEIHAGAKATLTEKGVYIVHCIIAPLSDYIDVIVIVDGGNTAPSTVQAATPTTSNVLVNGKQTAFDAYTVGGNNYFKLRDLAYVLNGTDKQFEVTWDGVNNAILLTSGISYTTAGGEMEGKGISSKTATPTSSKTILDDKEITLTAYTIDGNNYFKLRDIGQTFNFGVTWDGTNNTIIINTNTEYTE